jgi:ubiquinone/menaquinone biosynthesis C-methylase UbiE
MNEITDYKEKIADYWNWRSTTYHEEFSDYIDEEMKVWKNTLSEYIPEGKTIRAAEIGTGPGVLALALADMGHSSTGIDLSEEMIKKAAKRAEELGIDAKFMQGDAENLSLDDGAYDLVISKYLMWTLPHPEKFLEECRRILSPGGTLVLIDGVWFNEADKEPEPDSETYFEECYQDIKEALPLCKGNTADKVTAIVAEHGFSDASWQSLSDYDKFLREHSSPEDYAASYPAPPYIISAKKPC